MAIDNIMRIVAEYFGVTIEDLKGRSRAQSVSVPRKLACYVIKHTLPMSYEDLGTFMGLRDHSTVMYYIADVKAKLPDTPMYQQHLRAIDALLEQQFSAIEADAEAATASEDQAQTEQEPQVDEPAQQ